MKKSILFAGLASIVSLAACSNEEIGNTSDTTQQPAETCDAICFGSPYLSSQAKTASKGAVITQDSIYNGGNIGVFAFYQSTKTGNFSTYKHTYADYMNNQKVAYNKTSGKWEYAPLKYWPNGGEKVSFFAYAPYDSLKVWDEFNAKTDYSGRTLSVNFNIAPTVSDQYDILFAVPKLNLTKQIVSDSVRFHMSHITSQVNLLVGVDADSISKGNPGSWTDSTTTIQIKKVVFKDLMGTLTCSYSVNDSSVTASAWKASGDLEDIELTSDDFCKDVALIDTANYKNVTSYKQLNDSSCMMFIAPQQLGTVEVTYTMTTVDKALKGGKKTITTSSEIDLSSYTLESGYSYKIEFLIGMTTIKFGGITVDEWKTKPATTTSIPVDQSGTTGEVNAKPGVIRL